jgi:hypothetical protein
MSFVWRVKRHKGLYRSGYPNRWGKLIARRHKALDVYKDTVSACVTWAEATGSKRQERRKFSTFIRDLCAMADWLQACSVTPVAV